MRIGIDASRAFVNQPTGTERYAYEVITRMLKLPEAGKHEWILYTKSGSSRLSNPDFQSILQIKNLKLKIQPIGLKYLWTQAGLAARTWADGPEVLWIPAHTLPVLRKPGVRTVVTIHGIEYEWLPAYENWLQRWYLPLSTKYAVNRADRIIAVSEFTKRQLVQRLGAEERKIAVIYEGYNIPANIASGQPPDQGEISGRCRVLKSFGLKPREYLLFVGTVQPRKNLERLIEAFSRLKSEGLKLVVAGKLGWSYTKILEAPEKWGVKDKVVFCGYIDDYTREVLLKNSLIYVQPSITEGFGLPVLEAMAEGVAVVGSGGGALAEIIGDAGSLFNPRDVNDIFRKIKKAIESEKLRRELISRGDKRVKYFSWNTAAINTLKLIVSTYG